MNLATRCLQCGTVFRVAEEQLLSSEGWVRCGRCNGVFNATEVLFDIDTNAPMRLALVDEPATPVAPTPPGTPPAAAAAGAPAPGANGDPPVDPPLDASLGAPFDAPFESLLRAPSRGDGTAADEAIVITDHVPPAAPPASAPAPSAAAPAAADAPALRIGTETPPTAAPAPADTASTDDPALDVAAVAALPTASQATPSFLRQAERGRLLRHPAARATAVLAVLLLALALPLQMALLWRDSIAAQLPRTTPALQALCRLAGCSVQPLRRIHQLAVTSSGLNRVEGAPLYQLQLVLHNRADTAVMTPAVDLTLTDPQGQLLARRVLPAAELGLTPTAVQALQPGQELPIKLLLSTGDRRVAGYTLELFYP